ncbi:MAG: RnfABCDGE type electron transport complex subunit G [Paludibacteraceae bacterium]|nr:RnfABCDGE type electron transport complex subunit G [Paludibacteraceae bacterium]
MEKLKSSLPNMMLSLVLICVVAAGALAGVYLLTKEPIKQQQELAKQNALKAVVLPNADESVTIKDLSIDTIAITAPNQQDTAKLDTVRMCVVHTIALEDGTVIGKAVETGATGFGGEQEIMVGFDNEGVIINYQVLEQQETPGLGDHIRDWFNDSTKVGSYILGRQATGQFEVTKAKSENNNQVEAITAATISSKAFIKAINNAYVAFQKSNGIHVEAVSGASQLHPEEVSEEAKPEGEHHCQGHCQHGEGHQCQGHCQHGEGHHCQGHCQHGAGHHCAGHCQHHQQETEVTNE